jgi:hypothetical protein
MTIAGIQPLTGNPWCCQLGLVGNGEPEGASMADVVETVIEPRWPRSLVWPRAVDGQALSNPLLVSIDVSNAAFS